MNTQVSLSSGIKSPINLTNSILSHQENIKNELLAGLDRHIVWQTDAKEAIITTLLNGLFNVYREQGALGAVFLWGPTGVGKTELVRSLANILFGDSNAFTKISGEIMPHPAEISKLVWSSAWYIGYGDTPLMCDKRVHAGYFAAKEKWTLHPLIQGYDMINFSIVLIDEVEKAHPDIPNAFLNAIQSGEMEMASGKEGSNTVNSKWIDHCRVTDLQNTLFIFTSNIGEHSIQRWKGNSMWFTDQTKDDTGDTAIFEKELKKHFAPEFIGRMDKVTRCHSLTEEQMRSILALHVDKMNRILQKKGYLASITVATTRQFVDHILAQSKGIEYGARAISGIVKDIGSQVGLAIRSGRLPKDTNGIIEFDTKNGNPIIQFLDQPAISQKRMQEGALENVNVKEQIRTLVDGKVNRYGDQVRETVQEYLSLIAGYDTWFQSVCRLLERRLRWYGFNTEDIHSLQATAFLSIYESVEIPAYYEVIVRDSLSFEPVGFRTIEKYLRTAIASWFTLESMYNCIRVLLKRPMVLNEAIVVSQHLHRLIQQKKAS